MKMWRREKHLISRIKSVYWMTISVLFSNMGSVSLHNVCAAIWEQKFSFLPPGAASLVCWSWQFSCRLCSGQCHKHIELLPFSLMGLKQPGSSVDKAYCKYVPERRAGISSAGSGRASDISNCTTCLYYCSVQTFHGLSHYLPSKTLQ